MLDEFLGSLHKSAIEFPKEFKWLNTEKPITMDSLRGHVVILDFWTYCCINCMHMLPVLAKLEEKYGKKPFVIIGVHSAKFDNEKDPRNIREAINRYEVRHPVIVDEKMHLWKSYGVNAWPTLIFINPEGKIVYRIAGEETFEDLDRLVSQFMEKAGREKSLARKRISVKVPRPEDRSVFKYPGKLALSPDGKSIAISDSGHNRIVIATLDGRVERSIGGKEGLRDGSLKEALFFRPQGVIWPESGKMYVADTENHAMREIDLRKGKVTTLAGTGRQGGYTNAKSGSRGTETALSSPWDLVLLEGEIFIAMAGLHQIWRYVLETGMVYVYAGSGREGIEDGTLEKSLFAQPSGLALGGSHLYVADSEASGIRSISFKTGFVSTVIGSGLFAFGNRDGPVQEARLQHPIGVFADKGKIYVADTYNSAIKEIDTRKEKVRTLVSMKSKSECRIDDPDCDTLGLYEPNDVKLMKDTLYIADTNNHLIRKYDLKSRILTTLEIKQD